ncbi:MAG: hypothetical protein V5789_10585 [Colwellia sp.]
MLIDIDDPSDSRPNEPTIDTDQKRLTLTEKKIQAQAQKNLLARKRIDELEDKKRLKYLLDDSADW